jgi:murein DD-endopeptidase MepM/ murein hydrolase activator NlpD
MAERPPSARVARSRGRRRLAAALAACGLSGALCVASAGAALAEDDDRDAVAQKQQESAAHVEDLKNQLGDIDANLAQVYLDLDALNTQIPVAQQELAGAQSAYTAATREHEVALDQLESAQAENDRLDTAIARSRNQQTQASEAVAALAREMYRGEVESPMAVAMTGSSTQDIADRASAAEALARSQNKVLADARNAEVVQQNQAEKQKAVTERISALEQKAKDAADAAETAQSTAQSKVAELAGLKSQAQDKKEQWESQKTAASDQLDAWQAEYDAQSRKLADIDAQNRAQGRVYTTDGGMFSSPLPVALQITSPFGWRMHPVLGVQKYHNGTDFAAGCGTNAFPIAPGQVIAVTVETAGGNVVYVNHGMIDGHSWVSAYVHLQQPLVSVGQQVDRSSVVGLVGATGYATGCHLHLSLMMDGSDVDPMDYL